MNQSFRGVEERVPCDTRDSSFGHESYLYGMNFCEHDETTPISSLDWLASPSRNKTYIGIQTTESDVEDPQ